MFEAFRYSAVPWYQELARRIGKDTMQHWIDTLGYAQRYGKPVIKNNLDTFWLDNTVKVTADEQLGLVKKLYFGQLPFQPRSQRIVKNMMLSEDNSNYKLSYKTGWEHTEKGACIRLDNRMDRRKQASILFCASARVTRSRLRYGPRSPSNT